MPAPDYILPLGSTASFYDWFTSYNSNALGKLNKMYAYEVTGGNAIAVTNDNLGTYTVSLSNTVNGAMTFNGAVSFNGAVNLSSSQTSLSNISAIFSGNYSSSGVTLGKVVRITSTGGLSLAHALGKTHAEAIGIVTDFSTTSCAVSILGTISGSTLTSELVEGSGVFSTGCVYFLSDTTPGKVKLTEPTTIGTVSKPILIATGHNSATIIPFRGQFLNDTSTSPSGLSGAGGFDSVLIGFVSKGESEENYQLAPGSLVAISGSKPSGLVAYSSIPDPSLYYYKATSSTSVSSILGIVTGYANSNGYTGITGELNFMVVRPFGSVVEYNDLNWPSEIQNAGLVYLDKDGNPSTSASTQGPIGIATNDYFTLIAPNTSSSFIPENSSGSSSNTKSRNMLINGSLHIWQRRDYGDFPGVTGYTSASDFYVRSSATGGYFADRWCILNSYPSGQTFTIIKKNFSQSQIDVLGYPKHYFNLAATRSGTTHYFEFENRTQDARNNSNKQMIFSFYAKKNGAGTGVTFTPYVKQYETSLTRTTSSDIFISSSSWQRYSSIINVPVVSGTSFEIDSYFSVGLRSKSSTFDVDFAQFMFENGTTYSTPELIDVNDEYKKCSYYYQRSYPVYTRTGAITLNRTDVGLNSVDTDYFNSASNVYLGGAEKIVIMNYADIDHTVKLPVRMRPSSYFTPDAGSNTYPFSGTEKIATMTKPVPIKLFSPTNGIGSDFVVQGGNPENNMYNITAKANLNKCNGTNAQTYYSDLRTRLGITSTQVPVNARQYLMKSVPYQAVAVPGTDGSVESIGVRVMQGYVPMDMLAFHYVVDLDLYHGLT